MSTKDEETNTAYNTGRRVIEMHSVSDYAEVAQPSKKDVTELKRKVYIFFFL